MIWTRFKLVVDGVLEKVLERSKYRDPNYIRVNGRWVHVGEYAETVGHEQED